MNDIKKLIYLNIEIEGLLRVLLDRDNADTRDAIKKKFAAYSDALSAYLADESAASQSAEPLEEVPATTEDEPATIEDEPATIEDEPAPQVDNSGTDLAPTKNERLAKAFTVNDRFRFSRSLFNNNTDDFNDTIDVLSMIDNYAEARQYLLDDLMWNADDDEVKDFIEIVKQSMPQ